MTSSIKREGVNGQEVDGRGTRGKTSGRGEQQKGHSMSSRHWPVSELRYVKYHLRRQMEQNVCPQRGGVRA